jgi:hypothetical protein
MKPFTFQIVYSFVAIFILLYTLTILSTAVLTTTVKSENYFDLIFKVLTIIIGTSIIGMNAIITVFIIALNIMLN